MNTSRYDQKNGKLVMAVDNFVDKTSN